MPNFLKLATGGVLVLSLAACGEPTAEQIARVNAALPEGCTLTDLGSYGSVQHLIVVNCVDRTVHTSTAQYIKSYGKTSASVAEVTVTLE